MKIRVLGAWGAEGLAQRPSAFLVNDTICLVLTPLVLELTTKLERDPRPYLLATAMASSLDSSPLETNGGPRSHPRGPPSRSPFRQAP